MHTRSRSVFMFACHGPDQSHPNMAKDRLKRPDTSRLDAAPCVQTFIILKELLSNEAYSIPNLIRKPTSTYKRCDTNLLFQGPGRRLLQPPAKRHLCSNQQGWMIYPSLSTTPSRYVVACINQFATSSLTRIFGSSAGHRLNMAVVLPHSKIFLFSSTRASGR